MKNLTTIKNDNIVFGSYREASDLVQNQTFDRILKLLSDGYKIYVGNNPWRKTGIRVSQVNSRYHGRSIRTIWADKNLTQEANPCKK